MPKTDPLYPLQHIDRVAAPDLKQAIWEKCQRQAVRVPLKWAIAASLALALWSSLNVWRMQSVGSVSRNSDVAEWANALNIAQNNQLYDD